MKSFSSARLQFVDDLRRLSPSPSIFKTLSFEEAVEKNFANLFDLLDVFLCKFAPVRRLLPEKHPNNKWVEDILPQEHVFREFLREKEASTVA
jgi:hypothetical protein